MSKILVFGDSIAWGAVDIEKGGWVERLKLSLLPKDIDVVNCGISGDTTTTLLKRFESEATARLSKDKTIIIFAIGINDSVFFKSQKENFVNIATFEKNLVLLCSKAKKFSKSNNIFFIGLTCVDETKTIPISWDNKIFYKNSIIKKYDSLIKKVCNNNKVIYLSLFDLLKISELYDGLHPADTGHKKIFEKVEKLLKTEKII